MSISKIEKLKIIEAELTVLHSLHASTNWLEDEQGNRLGLLLLSEIKERMDLVEAIIIN